MMKFLPEILALGGAELSLPLRGLRKASLVDGLQAHGRITGHLPGWEGGTVQDQGCIALTAGHRTWSQPNTGHPALHFGSRTQLSHSLRMLSAVFRASLPSGVYAVSPASQTSCNTQSRPLRVS